MVSGGISASQALGVSERRADGGVIVPGAVDVFLDVKPAQQNVFVFVDQPNVVGKLKALVTFLYGFGQPQHDPLVAFRFEHLAVGNAEVVVQVVDDFPGRAPTA